MSLNYLTRFLGLQKKNLIIIYVIFMCFWERQQIIVQQGHHIFKGKEYDALYVTHEDYREI